MSTWSRTRGAGGMLLVSGIMAVLLTGCAVEKPPEPTTKPSPTAAAEPTPTEKPWKRFSDARISESFEVPEGWTVEPLFAEPENDIYTFGLFDADGLKQLEFAHRVTGLGGACGEEEARPELVELDSEVLDLPGYLPDTESLQPLSSPRFAFRAMETDAGVMTGMSIVNDGEVPPSCYYYDLLYTADRIVGFGDGVMIGRDMEPERFGHARVFASMDEARDFAKTEEYKTLKRILTSFRLEL